MITRDDLDDLLAPLDLITVLVVLAVVLAMGGGAFWLLSIAWSGQ